MTEIHAFCVPERAQGTDRGHAIICFSVFPSWVRGITIDLDYESQIIPWIRYHFTKYFTYYYNISPMSIQFF